MLHGYQGEVTYDSYCEYACECEGGSECECEGKCECVCDYKSDAQVMELAQGGSLLDYVRQRKRLAESEACFFLQQIVHGLMHCHDMEVIMQLCPHVCVTKVMITITVILTLVLASPS